MPLQPDTIAALNEVIQRSHFTHVNRHEWTTVDHETLEEAIKLVERDVALPTRPVGWLSARARASMRAHRFGRR